MKQQDYILCQKLLSTNISQSKRITVYAQISPLQPLTIDSQRLRFVKIHKGKILSNVEEPLLPYIDLFIAQSDYRGRTNLKYKKKIVCSTIPYTNPNLVVSFKGTKIKLRDPQAHSAIIRDSQSRKSIMNQKVLEQLLRKTNIN